MSPTRKRPKEGQQTLRLSDAEWKVMGVVWERNPANAREVLETLEAETDWAYSTVKTLLTRLAEKGAVSVTKRGNTRWFEPIVSRTGAQRSALRSLLDRAFDGTLGSLVHHLVEREELSAEELDALEAIAAGEEDEVGRRGDR